MESEHPGLSYNFGKRDEYYDARDRGGRVPSVAHCPVCGAYGQAGFPAAIRIGEHWVFYTHFCGEDCKRAWRERLRYGRSGLFRLMGVPAPGGW